MTWIPIIALAIVVFLVTAFVLRMPRSGWTIFGAALMFGLSGYALQGSPGLPASPKEAVEQSDESAAAMVEARRDLSGPDFPPSALVVVADGFARNGKYADAAGLLGGAVERDPRDAEAWVALGNALLGHAEGNLTPAALFAYSRAELADPGNPAAGYFYGVALLNAGQPQQTREVWAEVLENAPEDAEWRDAIAGQIERLDALLNQGGM
ncbi:MAG: tetratricopeptide repeat protein [Sphingomonadaceae bacterium]|jgi:cytochrome c-type biogenesis protein CcmH|nr:tetratricopeptide repeat protein [Sphingomonadaceae bacterium]MCP5384489.1 tetratricopeptide repeat protein [Altererythrobacter sp.]